VSNVINFTAVLTARRIAAKQAEIASAALAHRTAKTENLADQLGGSLGAQVVASVIIEREEKEQAGRYVPAYCDPSNEVRGAKYETTRSLDIKDIAARMRADIKALKLNKAIKVSVRIQRFSGGCSIDIRATVPETFRFWSDAAASWFKQFPLHDNRIPLGRDEQHAPEYATLIGQLERIHGAYNRNNSDSSSDYFCVRYYGHASIDGAWQARQREAEASPGNYWSPDCV
jgi:hypothetical protein